jgi:hypothetical protein
MMLFEDAFRMLELGGTGKLKTPNPRKMLMPIPQTAFRETFRSFLSRDEFFISCCLPNKDKESIALEHEST